METRTTPQHQNRKCFHCSEKNSGVGWPIGKCTQCCPTARLCGCQACVTCLRIRYLRYMGTARGRDNQGESLALFLISQQFPDKQCVDKRWVPVRDIEWQRMMRAASRQRSGIRLPTKVWMQLVPLKCKNIQT